MKRRTFLKKSAVAGVAVGAGAIAAPAVVRAAENFRWKMTTSFPPGLPFYQSGPGSAEWIVKAIDELSGGRLKIKLYAAGELIPWNGGFDAVTGGMGSGVVVPTSSTSWPSASRCAANSPLSP